jgi:hypothetical protein
MRAVLEYSLFSVYTGSKVKNFDLPALSSGSSQESFFQVGYYDKEVLSCRPLGVPYAYRL